MVGLRSGHEMHVLQVMRVRGESGRAGMRGQGAAMKAPNRPPVIQGIWRRGCRAKVRVRGAGVALPAHAESRAVCGGLTRCARPDRVVGSARFGASVHEARRNRSDAEVLRRVRPGVGQRGAQRGTKPREGVALHGGCGGVDRLPLGDPEVRVGNGCGSGVPVLVWLPFREDLLEHPFLFESGRALCNGLCQLVYLRSAKETRVGLAK